MLTRREFVSLGLGVGAYFLLPTKGFRRPRQVVLPSLGGHLIVQLPHNDIGIANAQGYSYNNFQNNYYAALYHQQQMIMWAQQRALAWAIQAAWQQRMQQMHWATEQHRLAMYNYMTRRPQYQYANEPQAWEDIESVYALAIDTNNTPILFGANKRGDEVEINKTVKGATRVFQELNVRFPPDVAHRSVGPQTSEQNAKITLPNGEGEFDARGYQATGGVLAVTDSTDFESTDGRKGALVKYRTYNGESYLIV